MFWLKPVIYSGSRIDSMARAALWNVGLDYLHGTGHGVGSFLNVHEGKPTWLYQDMWRKYINKLSH